MKNGQYHLHDDVARFVIVIPITFCCAVGSFYSLFIANYM